MFIVCESVIMIVIIHVLVVVCYMQVCTLVCDVCTHYIEAKIKASEIIE
jgi:hypothetical protein